MKNIKIKKGQSIRIRTINGDIVIEQTNPSNAPAKVLFQFRNMEQESSEVYEFPLTGLPVFEREDSPMTGGAQ
jgi:hypothetical protein